MKQRLQEAAMYSTRRAGRMAGAAMALGMLGMMPGLSVSATAAAQARGPVQRVVKGRVETKDGGGVKGAIVYLRDGRTQAVRSAISDDDGSYRFVQLTQGTDYELWAQKDAGKSKTKAISSFDSKNDFTINLTLE